MRKVNIIFATDDNLLFGVDNLIPWSKEEYSIADLRHFNRITLDTFEENVIVSGRKTFESLPSKLKGRVHVILSSKRRDSDSEEDVANSISDYWFEDLETLFLNLHIFRPTQKIFIIGGAKLIESVFTEYLYLIENIYYTRIHSAIDTSGVDSIYFDGDILSQMMKYKFREKKEGSFLTFYHLQIPDHEEFQYLNVATECLAMQARSTRNAVTYSFFNKTLSFDLQKGFPLLTTKKVFMRGIFEELIFFLGGKTDSKILESKNVNIWKPNTTVEFIEKCGLSYREGDMGPMYGFNWKHFGTEYISCDTDYKDKGYNQMEYILNLLENDPSSRRIIMTTYDPSTAGKGVLYPCHSIVIQLYVNSEYIVDMNMYQRSVDVACGLPFNIASNALLLHLICQTVSKRCEMKKIYTPGKLNLILGDIHIYAQHRKDILEQCSRLPYKFPTLVVNKNYTEIEDYKFEDITIQDYKSHPSIRYEMVA